MTQPNTDPEGGTAEETFTRAQVRSMIGAELRKEREKLAEKYGDYDDLKRAAGEADKSKSDIEKLTASVQALTDRATRAEETNTRREIADEFGLTPREARRLQGGTADELRADAESFVEDLGIDVKARKAGKPPAASAPKGAETEDDDGEGDEPPPDSTRRSAARSTARPRENLSSGAPRTPAAPEETNPLKLVADIPRR